MQGKKVIVGITGGIAAYKAAELIRLLVKEKAHVRVVMTAEAVRFITPLTLEALSGNRVISDMWDPEVEPMAHISWGQESDLIVIAPATANVIGKMAHGIGDDFLTTMILASSAPVLICPAMNTQMFINPAVKENIQSLMDRGYGVMEPEAGELACGTEGAGRLPDPNDILERIDGMLHEQDILGMRVLVTAGPTVEPIDPVRYLTNRSSGKMGYALARAAVQRGASVILVSGPTDLKVPQGVCLERVGTAEEMRESVFKHRSECDVIIKAAAVSDYRPREQAPQKMKKREPSLTIELEPNPDILAELGRDKKNHSPLLVGFAAETEDLLAHAREKLEKKNLDMIVANDVSRKDAGFEADTNLVKIITRDGQLEELPLLTKREVADHIFDRIKILWNPPAP